MAEIAGRQWGRITLAQLLEAGVAQTTIESWIRTGWLHRVHRGVYAVGHAAPSMHATFMGAVLAIGADAYLSHLSAALMWKLLRIKAPVLVDVTCPRRVADRATIRTHWTRHPHSIVHEGIPVSTPLQVVLDIAGCLTAEWLLRRAASQAMVDGHFTYADLAARCAARTGHHGAARITRLLPKLHKTRSGLEELALELIREHRLPLPQVNAIVLGREVDLLWPLKRLVVEVDGAAYHQNPFAAHEDAAKQAFLEAHGYRVLRITEAELVADGVGCARRIRGALAV